MKAGFTLLEVLIALVVIGLVATVLLNVHVHGLRVEQRARVLDAAALAAEKIATATWLGQAPTEIRAAAERDGWQVRVDAPPDARVAGAGTWRRWEIVPSNAPAARTVFYLGRPGAAEAER